MITPDQLAGWGPGYRDRIVGVGVFEGAGRTGRDAAGNTVVRPFGLGSEIGAGAFIAALALPGLIALFMSTSIRSRLALAPLAIGIALAVATSGNRGAPVMVFLSVFAFLGMAAISREATRAIIGFAVGGVLLFGVYQELGPNNAATNRARDPTSPSKIMASFSAERLDSVNKFDDYALSYPLGVGVGTVGPATAVSGRPSGVSGFDSETLWNFLVIETGLAGVALIVVLMLRLVWLALTRIRFQPDPAMRLYLAALAPPVFGMIVLGFGTATTIAVPFGPFLWLVAGSAELLAHHGAQVARAGARRRDSEAGSPSAPAAKGDRGASVSPIASAARRGLATRRARASRCRARRRPSVPPTESLCRAPRWEARSGG